MKRSLYILPLMTFTALSLTLAGCDDKKTEEAQTPVEQSSAIPQEMPQAAPESMPESMPETATPAPAAATALISVSNPTSYATAEGAKTGAVFVTLQNPQDKADKLIGAKTDKAATVEIHESFINSETGTMQMRKVDGVEIPAGGIVELKPGGYHIMLMDLAEPLVAGQSFDITLTFEQGGEAVAPVSIVSPVDAQTSAPAVETPVYEDTHSHDHASPETPSAEEPVEHDHSAE